MQDTMYMDCITQNVLFPQIDTGWFEAIPKWKHIHSLHGLVELILQKWLSNQKQCIDLM